MNTQCAPTLFLHSPNKCISPPTYIWRWRVTLPLAIILQPLFNFCNKSSHLLLKCLNCITLPLLFLQFFFPTKLLFYPSPTLPPTFHFNPIILLPTNYKILYNSTTCILIVCIHDSSKFFNLFICFFHSLFHIMFFLFLFPYHLCTIFFITNND